MVFAHQMHIQMHMMNLPGRSLREFDLERRLMRYPCSYMIYTEAFDALPSRAKEAVYRRMWRILSGELSGEVSAAKYERFALADRRAVLEILRDTKKDLPDYFQRASRWSSAALTFGCTAFCGSVS